MLLFCQSKPIAFFALSRCRRPRRFKHSTWPRRPKKTPYRDRWCRMSTMQAKLTYQARFPISPHARKTKRKLVVLELVRFFFSRARFSFRSWLKIRDRLAEERHLGDKKDLLHKARWASFFKTRTRAFELQFQLFFHALFLSKCYFFQTEFKLSDRIIPATPCDGIHIAYRWEHWSPVEMWLNDDRIKMPVLFF